MSRGFGGRARMVIQDEETVIYEYAPYNLNEERYRNEAIIYDGLITISKIALVDPEIHEKIKKRPSGKKQLIKKRIPRKADYTTLIETGLIRVENSHFCWSILSNGVGKIAMYIVFKIFDQYQTEGALPEKIGYHV